MKNARLIATLNAIGSLIDGLIAELEEDTPSPALDEAADECAHPAEQREDLTTMGGPEGWLCRSCGFSTLSEENTHLEEEENVSNSR